MQNFINGYMSAIDSRSPSLLPLLYTFCKFTCCLWHFFSCIRKSPPFFSNDSWYFFFITKALYYITFSWKCSRYFGEQLDLKVLYSMAGRLKWVSHSFPVCIFVFPVNLKCGCTFVPFCLSFSWGCWVYHNGRKYIRIEYIWSSLKAAYYYLETQVLIPALLPNCYKIILNSIQVFTVSLHH